MSQQEARKHIAEGAIWRRKRTGALLRITKANPITPTYFDIAWETVATPKRRGHSYEEYWLRNCEPTTEAREETTNGAE